MSGLQVGPIRDFSLGIYDGPHATPKESDAGPIFLGIKNVTPQGTLDLSEIRHVSEEDYPKWTKRVVPRENDIVFSYEATLHRYAVIPAGFRGCLGRRMALVRPDQTKVNPRFLHYYFLTPAWRAVVESNVISGATVDRIPLIRFPDFEVRLPLLGIQERIASILSAYDDLIENNRRRTQLLEQAARLLYKEWFVHLRFPGHEHVKVIDGVPEGWGKEPLGDVVEVAKGRNITKDTAKNGPVPVVAGGLAPAYYHDIPNARGPVITVSASGANAGFVNIYFCDIWASDCSYISADKTDAIFFVYLMLASRQREISGLQRGAAQPHVYPKDLQRLPVLLPSKQVLRLFEASIVHLFSMVACLQRQNDVLAKARDLLLPRLMNGEIEL
jgi:type I restriction enzyme, S subunit